MRLGVLHTQHANGATRAESERRRGVETQAALHVLDTRTQACDVAIVDIFLQSGSGLGVLQHIAGYERPPERIVFTNYATDAMRERCKQLGAAAVFDKSTEIEKLVDWLAARGRH